MIDIYLIAVNENVDDNKYNEICSYVSQQKRELIKRYHFNCDKKRMIYSEATIRWLVSKKKNINNSDIEYIYDINTGKPFIKNCPDIKFNISHSGDWIVCALCDNEIGIDIELIQDIDLDVAKHFYTKSEYNDLMLINASDRLEYFYTIWTLKESYGKCIGKGINILQENVNFKVIDYKVEFLSDNSEKYYFYCIDFFDNKYKLSMCTKKEKYSININNISIYDIKIPN